MKFKKGKPKSGGRQPGTQNKATETIKGIALGLVQDPDYLASLKKRMVSGRSPQLEILMHYYGYGKPKTEISEDTTIRVFLQDFRNVPPSNQTTVINAQTDIEHGENNEDLDAQ